MLTIMLPCKHNVKQFIQLKGWPESTRQAGIFADFMKVICNWHFIQLQITCNIVIKIQLQLLVLKCNSITITITSLVIQLRNSIRPTCISITEQHWHYWRFISAFSRLDLFYCTYKFFHVRIFSLYIDL